MAGETTVNEGATNSIREESSWVRKYFVVKNVTVKDKKTGVESAIPYDVCNLPSIDDATKKCEKQYKRNVSNGTKTLQRHLTNKHLENENIAEEVKKRNIGLPKVII